MKIGDNWNGWRVAEVLGEGQFGQVYRIERKEYGHTYSSALKVVRIPRNQSEVRRMQNEGMNESHMTAYFESMVDNIVSEFTLMSQLRGNSNIVSYEDHSVVKLEDSFGWDVFIRMELLTPLFDYIAGHSLTVNDVVQLGIDICKALELCHRKNIIHRDIKPENIFYSDQGSFKLGDFGIARELEKTMAGLTRTGTPTYMAPEVYRGLPYNSSVDTYSLGILLYRFLNNNRTPFLPEYPDEVLYTDHQIANIRRLNGESFPAPCNATSKLSKIILKACAYDAKDRFASAAEMRKALEAYKCPKDENKILLPPEMLEIVRKPITDQSVQDPAPETIAITREIDPTDEKAENVGENSDITSKGKVHEPISKQAGRQKKRLLIAAAVILAIAVVFAGFRYFNHTVPDVVTLHSDAAKISLEDAGLKYHESDRVFSDSVPRDVIISQSIKNGEKVKRGTVVDVVVSKGVPIELPDVTGRKKSAAEKILKEKNLLLEVKEEKYSDSIKKGRIISQDPNPGTECEEEQVIQVILSKGPKKVTVPDVIGMSQEEGEKELEKAKLKYEINYIYSNSAASGIIVDQSEPAGEKIAKNSTVVLSVSLGSKPYNRSGSGSGSGSRQASGNSENTDNTGNENETTPEPTPVPAPEPTPSPAPEPAAPAPATESVPDESAGTPE